MTLAAKQWKRVSVHRVIFAFLIAERDTNVQRFLLEPGRISTADASR